MASTPQNEARRIREQIVVDRDGWVWQPAQAPFPPSVEVVLNGRRMENVAYAPGAGLLNLAWPIARGDVLSITYNPWGGVLP